mgnify:CR=1 FL=1
MSNNDEQVYAAPESELMDENTMQIDESDLATRGTRLGAAALDLLILILFFIPGVVLYFVMGDGFENADYANTNQMQLMIDIYLYSGVFLLAYVVINGILLYKHGQTMAKRLLKIKIVRTDGDRVGFARMLGLRIVLIQVLYQIPVLGFLFMIVNLLFIFREDHRCIHDLIADTKVIDTP